MQSFGVASKSSSRNRNQDSPVVINSKNSKFTDLDVRINKLGSTEHTRKNVFSPKNLQMLIKEEKPIEHRSPIDSQRSISGTPRSRKAHSVKFKNQ